MRETTSDSPSNSRSTRTRSRAAQSFGKATSKRPDFFAPNDAKTDDETVKTDDAKINQKNGAQNVVSDCSEASSQFDLSAKDKTPRYTVQQTAKALNMSPHTIRFYTDQGLVPSLARSEDGTRLFSEFDFGWIRIARALRFTGLSIAETRHYVDLCLQGESTIPERAKIIFEQEAILRERLEEIREQFRVLDYKKTYYRNLLNGEKTTDACNPGRK